MKPQHLKYALPFLLLLTSFLSTSAQEEDEPPKWALNGYVKDLQSVFILQDFDQTLIDNFFHNRLNFRYFPDDHWTLYAELRTRLFWGDQGRTGKEMFLDQLDLANDYADLSVGWANEDGIAFHSIMDRLYLEYIKNNLEIRLGRQRINWGISTIWNPNDVFNAYNFTDFDYEERPGSDALRVRYYTGFASSIELAVTAFDTWDEAQAALLWKTNQWSYDFQLLAGIVQEDWAFGGGWAGNIGNTSFKGEFTYFHPRNGEDDGSFTATVGMDYSFANSLYINGGFLFNSNGSTNSTFLELLATELSAKNLYPYKYSVLAQASYPITPLLNASMATIYSPSSVHALFLTPTVTYSIKENWDLDFVSQLAFVNDDGYSSPIQAFFLRWKFSF